MAANPSIQLGTDGNWAIKEDNLLAYKKDGTRFFNKEFDFTRGSSATYVAKDGLIKVSGVIDTELVVNGDFATDSDWFKTTGWSISNGQAIANTGAYNTLQQVFPIVLGKTYEVKFDVTSITSGSVSMTLGADSGLQRNQIGSYTEIIEYNNFFASSGPRSGSGGFVGSIDNISVKEIQLDVPRIDFTDDATGHLLLEPQSTNLVTYSEDFSQSSWVKLGAGTGSVAVVTNNFAISPDGTQNASRLQCNLNGGTTTSDQSLIYDLDTTNTTKTISVYMKSNNSQNQTIYFTNTFTGDSRDEAIVTTQWQRFTFTHSTSNHTFSLGLRGNTGSDDAADILIWGAQAEALSFATSYIPTYGSSATRLADACNNSGSAQDFNDSEGVLYAEMATLADDSTLKSVCINDSTTGNRVIINYSNQSNRLTADVRVGGVGQAFMQTFNFTITNFLKIGLKYKANDFALWVNGTEVATDNSGSTFSANTLNNLSFDNGAGGEDFYGKTKNLKVFKRAMSDGELYLLTVTQYQSYQAMATALNYTL